MTLTAQEATLAVAGLNTAGVIGVAWITRSHGRKIGRTVDEVREQVRTSNGHTIGELVEQTAAAADTPDTSAQRTGS